jgi:tetratricopeptide repeat protein
VFSEFRPAAGQGFLHCRGVLGDFRSALRHDRQTLERRTSLFGPRHPRTLNSGAAVARDLLEAGRYKEAARMMEDVVARSHETLGDDARDTLNARLWLGVAQRCAGQAKQAAATIEAARSGLSRGFGMDSSDALASRLSQALNLIALGGAGVRDGRAAAADILRIYDARVGAAHPHSLICMLNIASAFYLEGDIATAYKHAEAAVSGMERRLGPAHPYTLAAKMVQASVLARLEKLAEAAGLEELVVAGRTAVLGAEHPDTLRSRANQLLTLQQQGEAAAAGEHQEVVGDLKERLGAQFGVRQRAAVCRRTPVKESAQLAVRAAVLDPQELVSLRGDVRGYRSGGGSHHCDPCRDAGQSRCRRCQRRRDLYVLGTVRIRPLLACGGCTGRIVRPFHARGTGMSARMRCRNALIHSPAWPGRV